MTGMIELVLEVVLRMGTVFSNPSGILKMFRENFATRCSRVDLCDDPAD